MTYVVNKNMPGYLPESEPTEVKTFDEALAVIEEEVNRDLDDQIDGESFDSNAREQLGSVVDEAGEHFEEELKAARSLSIGRFGPESISFRVLNYVYFAQQKEPTP